jgi:two-component system sensor kinase FixL
MSDSPRRELTLATMVGDGGMVEVSVSDTGPGLAEEVAERLFQPFVTTKRHGMGVGLSISRTIVDAHGGKIWAEKGAAGGTVFRFSLRAAAGEELVDA